MANPPPSLPPGVAEALARGNLIEAIKLFRSSGMGLKQAKDAVDAHLKGKPVAAPAAFSGGMGGALPPGVVEALQQGQKIEAIRLMREQAGLGLKEAKEAVEAYERTRAPTLSDLSPGQVGDTGSGIWWVVVLVLVCVAGFLIIRRLV